MAENEEFARTLRTAIARSRLSLTDLSHRMRGLGHPLSPAALSTWQSGRRRPDPVRSTEAVACLELILGEDPDTLLDLLISPPARGRALRHTDIADFLPESAPIRRAYAALDFTRTVDLPHERFVREVLVVDGQREVQTVTFQIMVRALRVGPCRVPTLQQFSGAEEYERPEVVALERCTVGRRLAWPEDHTFATELLVEEHMEIGQQAFFSFQVRFPLPARSITELNYAVPRRTQDFMVEAVFRGTATPVGCEKYVVTDGQPEQTAPVRLDADGRLQAAESGFGPGKLGLRWQWLEQDG